ncbi:MAG: DUF2628 domain-containing protein [Pseudomonadota bacterium]
MATYTAYLPPHEWVGNPEDGFKLLPDGKAPLALVFPPFWLAWHRLWLPLMLYVVVAFGIILLAVWKPGLPVAYLSALPGFYLLLEGAELIRRKYERNGWRYAGVVEGDKLEDAEIRFLTSADFHQSQPAKVLPMKPERPFVHNAPANTGLFPE